MLPRRAASWASVSGRSKIEHRIVSFRVLAEKGEYGPVDVDTTVREHLASVGERYVAERTRANGASLEILRHPIYRCPRSRAAPRRRRYCRQH